jgi:hypothetical protein
MHKQGLTPSFDPVISFRGLEGVQAEANPPATDTTSDRKPPPGPLGLSDRLGAPTRAPLGLCQLLELIPVNSSVLNRRNDFFHGVQHAQAYSFDDTTLITVS